MRKNVKLIINFVQRTETVAMAIDTQTLLNQTESWGTAEKIKNQRPNEVEERKKLQNRYNILQY